MIQNIILRLMEAAKGHAVSPDLALAGAAQLAAAVNSTGAGAR